MLNLPPPAPTSPPALTAKEKKRLRLEKEKERQQELFEKNFKRKGLFLCIVLFSGAENKTKGRGGGGEAHLSSE